MKSKYVIAALNFLWEDLFKNKFS